jgi:hypothetical protein
MVSTVTAAERNHLRAGTADRLQQVASNVPGDNLGPVDVAAVGLVHHNVVA